MPFLTLIDMVLYFWQLQVFANINIKLVISYHAREYTSCNLGSFIFEQYFVSIAQNSQEVMLLSVFKDNRMVLDHVSAGLFARMTELFLPHISCKQSIIYA